MVEKYPKRWSLRGYQPPLLRPKTPLRVILAVTMNVILFVGATMLLGYLRTGKWLAFSAQAFHADMSRPTAEVFTQPLGVLGHPWMIAIFAILLGMMIFAPLAIAVMYQLLFSLVLTAMIAVFGHCPFFALAMAVGCLLSARTSLRRSWPLGAMLLGMLPAAIFWYLLAYPGLDTSMLDAIQRWIIIVTITAAFVLAVAESLISVMIVRLRKFQPGAIWPLLLVAVACAAGVFFWKITPAELEYQLLIGNIDNEQTIFNTQPRQQAPRNAALSDRMHEELLDILADLDKRKDALDLKCQDFLKKFPKSQRSASVTWLRGTIANLQFDTSEMDDRSLSYTAEFLEPQSEKYWQSVINNYPNSDQAALAEYNLALLRLRSVADEQNDEKKLEIAREASRMLNNAKNNLQQVVDLNQQTGGEYSPITQAVELPGEQTYENALFEAKKLTWQIFDNEVLSNPVAAEALAKFLAINPFNPQYDRKIKRLAADPKYAACPLGDNLKLAVAKLNKNPYDRAEAIMALTTKPDSDAAIEANYELGRISMQTANARVIRLILKQPEYYFEQVATQRFNPWRAKAAKQLEWLEASHAMQENPTTQNN